MATTPSQPSPSRGRAICRFLDKLPHRDTHPHLRHTLRMARVSRTLVAIAAALLFLPPAQAEVPLAYAESGHPTVPTLIGGKGPFQFVIDTGAEGSALYTAFAAEQGLQPIEGASEDLQGQTGAAPVQLANLPSVSLDGRVAHNIRAAILPDRADGVKLPGILGLDVIGNYAVEFDVPGNRVALHPPGTMPARLGNERMQPIQATRLKGGLLGLPVTINGAQGIAVLDTGARDTRINWRFARAAGLNEGSPRLVDDTPIQGATNRPVASKRGNVGTIDFGAFRQQNASVRIVDLPVFEAFGVADRPAMILGMDLLKQVHMLVDFQWQTVWMAGPPPAEPAPAEVAPADAAPAATPPTTDQPA